MARSSAANSSRRNSSASGLLTRAREGDRQALGELLERFRPAMQEWARQFLPPALAQKVGASDLVQETCLDAMRDFGAARVQHAAAMEAWLLALLTNNLKDWQRKFKSSRKRDLRRERPLGDVESKLGLLEATLASSDSSPESRVLRQESRDLVTQALERLPRGYKQIIVWRNDERQSWAQIGRRLDRSQDAVRMLWKRAIERLKREIRGTP
jgi:RNA polymerase sigma-70 factor (ECF subfamily)